MGRPTTLEVSEASSTQASEVFIPSSSAPLSRYAVDLQVKKTPLFGGNRPQYVRRRFVITGQTLKVYGENNKREHSFRVRGMAIEHVSSHYYRLRAKPWHRLDISCPSTSRMERFRRVLQLAATTPYWTPPQFDPWTNFLHVAKEINETEAAAPSNVAVSTVTVAQVQEHLNEMLAMYEFQSQCSSMLEVYSHLLNLEADYCQDRNVSNYAHTVHRLHPATYANYLRNEPKERTSIMEMYSKCPHPGCDAPISIENMYKFHIKGEDVPCSKCSNLISLAVYGLVEFVATIPEISVEQTIRGMKIVHRMVTPDFPADGKVGTFMAAFRRRLKDAVAPNLYQGSIQLQYEANMKITLNFQTSTKTFGFDLVKAMIRQLDFVNKICPNYNYWSHAEVLQASIVRYHKFMHLMKIKERKKVTVPTADIDLVWHTHQVDFQAYDDFCMKHVGYFVDHDDTIEFSGLLSGYHEALSLWFETYQEPYSTYVEYDSMDFLFPSHDCRFYGVDEPFPIEDLSYSTAVMPDEMAVASADEPPPDNLTIYVAVIGTPVKDGRVRLKYSRHSYLMAQGRLGYVHFQEREFPSIFKPKRDGMSSQHVHVGCANSYNGGCASVTQDTGGGGCGGGGCG
ncbi:unnamed protein product [Aphanomyces euteiches]|uniref:Uncharacterized protein n=1 Tax=Aphanomyces euteiches TaxID=100861 RepID=A0A6G0XUC5_9STRA|nr:hypothetical protein Ae201684_001679 [Aphanomyces euteiches]KAH9075325.1 hypothetical protein Ae201684P_004006 [Aphanomyces euteiches]KAH9151006.1 hypothetical protein AeRB84_006276 [Aphanomyces euteiches]